jgi:hypothetical protein
VPGRSMGNEDHTLLVDLPRLLGKIESLLG